MTFSQSSWQLHNSNVYNITGDLHLTERSGPADFVAVVEELRARVRALENVPEPELAAVDAELAQVSALGESGRSDTGHADADDTGLADDGSDQDGTDSDGPDGSPDPDGSTRSGTAVRGLARVGALLRGLTGAANAANELGASVDQLAQWAGHHL
ncbi:hypothetical protein GCM10014715_01000 [Streptomyces spiralis]|uniref:Uncharacterized protein n=1 Tax=Streptomyces spiralis TaxID=66376 RepID=A0A918ZHQ4_9ACTN|nr:hypothetical protein [Streptomyces spiralis]GHE52182.1 hypothetical protein GCM10014715_01000 [Streptomyces spiralis]